MTKIAQGAHVYLFPEPGQVYRVQADDVATVQVLYGAPSAVITLTAQSRTFGPYDSPAKLKVTANTAPAEYTLIRAHYAELTQAQLDGGAVGALASNNAGGVIEPDGDVPTLGGSVTLPAMQTAFDTGTAPQKSAFQSSVSGDGGALVFIKPSGATNGTVDPLNFASAVASLPAAGGTVCLLPGTYYSNTNLAPNRSNVTVQAFMRRASKVVAVAPWVPSANQAATGVLCATGNDNVIFDGVWVDTKINNVLCNAIEICRSQPLGQGTPSTNCVVRHCKTTGAPLHIYQIWNYMSNGTRIHDNLVDGGILIPATPGTEAATQEGIEIYGGTDVEVYGNTVINCGANGIYPYTHIGDTAGCVLDTINIHDNVIDRCWNGINLSSSFVGGLDGYARNIQIKNNTVNRCWANHLFVDFPFAGAAMENVEIVGNTGYGATTAEGATAGVTAFLFNNQAAASAIKLRGKFLVAHNTFTRLHNTSSGGIRKIYGMPGGEFVGNTWGLEATLATGTARVCFAYGSNGFREFMETLVGSRYFSAEYILSSGFSVTKALYKDWNGAAAGTSAVIVNANCTDFTFADIDTDTATPTNIANLININATGIRRFEIRGLRYLNTAANRGNIGQISFNADQVWTASTAYTLMSSIRPTAGGMFYFQCITGGTSGATEPIWPSAVGAVIAVGTATFVCRSVWE